MTIEGLHNHCLTTNLIKGLSHPVPFSSWGRTLQANTPRWFVIVQVVLQRTCLSIQKHALIVLFTHCEVGRLVLCISQLLLLYGIPAFFPGNRTVPCESAFLRMLAITWFRWRSVMSISHCMWPCAWILYRGSPLSRRSELRGLREEKTYSMGGVD